MVDLVLTGHAGDGFLAGQIGDMHKGIVEGCEDVCHAEDEFSLCDLGAERNGNFLLGRLDFLGGLRDIRSSANTSTQN